MPIIFKFGVYFYIDFEEVISVFDDPYHITNIDDRFDYDELRMNTIGMTNQGKMLVVAWVQIDDENIRVITAFKPTKRQIKGYAND